MGEQAGEGFLGEIFGAMGIAEQAEAEAAGGFLPAGDEAFEGLGIVAGADGIHGLFVAWGGGRNCAG